METEVTRYGEPYAGKLHVRFDEGAGVPDNKGRSALLYTPLYPIGANYHEANRSESRDDFVHKVAIAVKEANESCYWFKVLIGLCGSSEKLDVLAKETCELRNLLQSILKSARSR